MFYCLNDVRETFEEIGVDPKQVTVLGSFHDAPSKTDVAGISLGICS